VDTKPSLAVLYFENLSGDESLEWLRTGLTDMLVTDLAQSPSIRVLGTDRLHQILEDIGAADDEMTSSSVVTAVAEQGDVDHVLLGSFARAGNLIRISARLQSAASGEILASETVEGEGEEAIFPLVDDLTRRIKAQFDMAEAMMAADVDADLTDVTTDSVEAYRHYAEGIMLHEQLREDEAIPLLERAAEIDPEFAMAHAKLAVAYGNIGDLDKAREHSAIAMEHLDRVTDRERYYIEGRHYSLEQGGSEQAIAAYERAVELYPDHTSARNNLAQQLVNLERFDEAIRHFEHLRSSGMQFPGTYASLANAYGVTGQFDQGLAVLEEYTERNPENAAGFENLAEHLAWAGRLQEASRTLDRAEQLGRSVADVGHLRWQIHMLAGDADAAEEVLETMSESGEIRARVNADFDATAMALFEGDVENAIEHLEELEGIAAARQQAFNIHAGVLLEIGNIDGALAVADGMLSEDENPQSRLDGLGTRALALAARDGMAAAASTFDQFWEQPRGTALPRHAGLLRRRLAAGHRVGFRSARPPAAAGADGQRATAAAALHAGGGALRARRSRCRRAAVPARARHDRSAVRADRHRAHALVPGADPRASRRWRPGARAVPALRRPLGRGRHRRGPCGVRRRLPRPLSPLAAP